MMLACRAVTWRLPLRAVLVALALGGTACGPAFVSPVLLPGEVAFDSLLVGSWIEAEPEDSLHPMRAEVGWRPEDGYAIAFTDEDGEVNHFTARLGRLAGWHLLELRPDLSETDADGELARSLMLPLHTIALIQRLERDEVRFALLEPETLERALRAEPRPTPWIEVDDDRVVLTGDAESLRSFLRGHLARPGALGESTRFVRRR